MRQIESSPVRTTSQAPQKSIKNTNGNGTRYGSSYSVSDLDALSDSANCFEDGANDADDDDDDDGADDDDDDDNGQQVVPVPAQSSRGSKTGMELTSTTTEIPNHDDHDGYDNSDSDDGYAAVDDITDGDDEEQDVEQLEEMLIVESEGGDGFNGSFGNSAISGTGDLAGPSLFDDNMLLPTSNFFDEEQLFAAMGTFGETDAASDAAVETPVPRRVHFEESDPSSSDSDSPTDDEIPGDFLQQDSLDPQLRRMIENDNGNDAKQRRHSDDVFGDSDYGHANIYHADSDAGSNGSSGYETDDGETTDEDLPPPATITHPRSILRRDSSTSVSPADDENHSKQPQPSRRRGPIMGSFVPDPHKPVALVDRTGRHLVIIPAHASSRNDWLGSATNSICGTASNSPRAGTMQPMDESDTDALLTPSHAELSPMLSSSANLMMTALGNDTTPGGQIMGPPEAFYPSRDLTVDSSFDEDEDDDDPEEALNVEDFIDFGDGSSDEEMEDDALNSPMVAAPSRGIGAGVGTPTPNPNRSADLQANSAERFLNHLDQGIVTAFRRNHNRYQTLLKLPHHREFMPANSPAKPASVFRHANAKNSDPRTPIRKRRSYGEAVRRRIMDTPQRSQLPF